MNIPRLLLVSAVCLHGSLLTAEPLKIICIGDSITQGGRADREEFTYRAPLFGVLKDKGIDFDFIGSRTAGLQPEAKWPDHDGVAFDADHEGYYGEKTAAVLEHLKKNLPDLPAPDIALIHLGTNDQGEGNHAETVIKPLEEMIAVLREKNPKVAVMVGHLNFNGGAAVQIRALVEDMAKKLHTPESPVVTVHHYQGWKENPEDENTDTYDWAHPNPEGQRKMAEAWLAAMKPWLPEPTEQ